MLAIESGIDDDDDDNNNIKRKGRGIYNSYFLTTLQ
jgi:hypothetical protein